MTNTIPTYNISDLAEYMRRAKDEGRPYVFFTGAGCSKTAGIPLAGELVDEMQKRFQLELKLLSDADCQDYGKCMAMIGRDDRRRFLKEYIDKAIVNWAHIALAGLLKEGYISRVLTFNFDNLLARACGLLGLYPATYDLTSANLNLYHLIDNPAIVHLHGQSHGFAQLNSDEETKIHAEQLSSFICNTLNESPTLFIGYSGQSDSFFPKIKDHFSGQHRLFWVNVSEQIPEHIASSIMPTRLAHYMCCAVGADIFLIELAQKLGCFPPTIFTDPYAHLLDELEAVAKYPQLAESNRSPLDEMKREHPISRTSSIETQDILSGIKERLKSAQQREQYQNRPNFLQLFLKGEYEQLISLAESATNLNEEERITVSRAYLSLAFKQTSQAEELKLYDSLIQRFGDSTELAIQEIVARAMVYKGFALGQLNRSDEEIAVYDDLIRRYGERIEQTLREEVGNALNGKGFVHLMLAKAEWQDKAIALKKLNIARQELQQALSKTVEENYVILGNLAYVEFLLEKPGQAEVHLRDALEQGGEKIYSATLKDIAQHPIPPDVVFQALLERLWLETNVLSGGTSI